MTPLKGKAGIRNRILLTLTLATEPLTKNACLATGVLKFG